jgi:hypothetical protein
MLLLSGCVNGTANENTSNILKNSEDNVVEKDAEKTIQQSEEIDDYSRLSDIIINTNNNEKTYFESSDIITLTIDKFAFETTSESKIKKINISDNDYEVQIDKILKINNGNENTVSIYAVDGYSYMELMGTNIKMPINDLNDFEITNSYKIYDIPKSSIMLMKKSDSDDLITYSYNVDTDYMEGVLGNYLIQQSKSTLYSELKDDLQLLDTMRLDISDVYIETVAYTDYVVSQKLGLKGFITINDNSMQLISSIEMICAPLNDDYVITNPNLEDYIELN